MRLRVCGTPKSTAFTTFGRTRYRPPDDISSTTCSTTPISAMPGTFSITSTLGSTARATSMNSRYRELPRVVHDPDVIPNLGERLARRSSGQNVDPSRDFEDLRLNLGIPDVAADAQGFGEVCPVRGDRVRVVVDAGQRPKARLAEAFGNASCAAEQINERVFGHGSHTYTCGICHATPSPGPSVGR